MSANQVKTGDVFNETDDDECIRVVSIHSDADPPIAVCEKVSKDPTEKSETTEYALPYVITCVNSRNAWNKSGYGEYDVRDVYRMSTKQLRHALSCARQSTKGKKAELRHTLIFYLNIVEVPSDVESNDSDVVPPNKRSKGKEKKHRRKSTRSSASAAASAVQEEEEEEEDSRPDLVTVEDEVANTKKAKKKAAVASLASSKKKDGGNSRRRKKRKRVGTNKRKSRRNAVRAKKKKGKHHAV